VRDEFDEPDYSMVDTLFSLAESHLWSQLVELADADPSSVPHGTDYRLIWRDVRSAVDLCHRDGTLKREVAADPAKYIHDDPHLVPMLLMLKRSGRKLFLATNSLWDYTSVVMNWCCGRLAGKRRTDDWLRLFDAVIVGCAKPGFFSERRPLFAVDPTDGSLRNTDGGAPIIPIGYDDLPADAVRWLCFFWGGGVVWRGRTHCTKFMQHTPNSTPLPKQHNHKTKTKHKRNKRPRRPRACSTLPPTTARPCSRGGTFWTCTRCWGSAAAPRCGGVSVARQWCVCVQQLFISTPKNYLAPPPPPTD
jgi:hypothetical protein